MSPETASRSGRGRLTESPLQSFRFFAYLITLPYLFITLLKLLPRFVFWAENSRKKQ